MNIQNVKTHSGYALEEDDDFIQPPEEIGEIITAQTSLKKWKKTIKGFKRAFFIVIPVIAMSLIIFSISSTQRTNFPDVLFYVFNVSFPVIGLFLGIALTSFSHKFSYVGEKGIAEFTLKKDRSHTPERDIFLFNDAESLYVHLTDNHINTSYTDTDYAYVWTDINDKAIYSICGKYKKDIGGVPKKKSDRSYFASSAEEAWNKYKLLKMINILNNKGKVIFKIKDSTTIVVVEIDTHTMNIYEENTMDIYKNKSRFIWNIRDIDSVDILEGMVTIYSSKYKDQNWLFKFFGKGTLSFPYSKMPNAQIFLLLFNSFLLNKDS